MYSTVLSIRDRISFNLFTDWINRISIYHWRRVSYWWNLSSILFPYSSCPKIFVKVQSTNSSGLLCLIKNGQYGCNGRILQRLIASYPFLRWSGRTFSYYDSRFVYKSTTFRIIDSLKLFSILGTSDIYISSGLSTGNTGIWCIRRCSSRRGRWAFLASKPFNVVLQLLKQPWSSHW